MTSLIYNNDRNNENIEINKVFNNKQIYVINQYSQFNNFNNEEFLNIFYNLYLKKLEFLIINKELIKQKETIKNLIESNNIMLLSIIDNEEMIRFFNFLNKELLIFSLKNDNENIFKLIRIIKKIKGE